MASVNFPLQSPSVLLKQIQHNAATAAPAAGAPAAAAAPAAGTAAPAATQDQGVKSLKKGSAQLSLSLDSHEAEIAAWQQAEQGPKLTLTPESGGQLGHVLALMKQASSATPAQKENLKHFFMGLQQGKTPTDRMKFLEIFDQQLTHKGITQKQLNLILDGKFTPEAQIQRTLDSKVI